MKCLRIFTLLAVVVVSLGAVGCCGKKAIIDNEQVKKTKIDQDNSNQQLEGERDKYKE